MRIYPALHYTMGGLWVDYNLMSNVPGLFVIGEANFSDHGANRLGASALMQGLADGYFVLPYTLTNWLAGQKPGARQTTDHPAFKRMSKPNVNGRILERLLNVKGKKTATEYHRESGKMLWDNVGMARTKAELRTRRSEGFQELRAEFWQNVNVPGTADDLNVALERANRSRGTSSSSASCWPYDALTRNESRAAATSARNTSTSDGECEAGRRKLQPRRRLGRSRDRTSIRLGNVEELTWDDGEAERAIVQVVHGECFMSVPVFTP